MDPGVTNITVLTKATRKNDSGIFVFPYAAGSQVTDSYFSLLKFHWPDDDWSLDCLAANISREVPYILVFPVKCNLAIADYFQCIFILPFAEIRISLPSSGAISLLLSFEIVRFCY